MEKEKLIKLIQENPNLPLVFGCANDERAEDYGSTVYNDFYCYVGEVWCTDDLLNEAVFFNDEDYLIEEYGNWLCCKKEYENLSDSEIDKIAKKWIYENLGHYKAIIIQCSL